MDWPIQVIDYLTAILAFITGIYAWSTNRMARAADASLQAVVAQSEAMLRPYVTISPWIRPKALFFYLRISNSGRTAATNLRLTIDRDFFQWGHADRPDHNLRTKSVFSQAIDSLSPGAELLFGLGQGPVLFGPGARPEVTPVQFSVTAAYEFFGKAVVEVSRIDLRPFLGSDGEPDPLIEELERIRSAIEKK